MDGVFRPGTILLEKYRVESVLGRGGMGVVLKVTHLHLGEELALKILSPEAAATPDVHARFLREAQSVVRLRGEHVARVFDVGILPDRVPYMVMEYLRGVDLAGELNRRRTLIPGEAVDYVLQACEALAEAHANAVVHRDIKPANLFLTARPDGTPLVKVLDFGISKVPFSTSGVMTKTDTVMGTPGYMSPEQMKATRDVDARTDIWALGIVLYECLTGRRPFDAESFSAVVLMAATEPPPPMDPRIPRGLQGAVLRCLEKDRRARFSSIAELAEALAPFARDHRASAMVVDRTRLMLPRPGSVSELAAAAAQSSPPTTLSGSAGVARSRSRRRRYVIAGVLSVLGSIVVLVAATLAGTGRSSNHGLGVASGSDDAGRPADDRVAIASLPSDAEARSPATITLDAAATTNVVVKPDDDRSLKTGKCTELSAQRDWRGLDDCATALEALGAKDSAKAFHAKAKQEAQNESEAQKGRQALRDGTLKDVQASLKVIGPDSVYYAALNESFTKAEALAVEEARRKAQGYANGHDCAGLKRYVGQLTSSSTARVITTVQDINCTEKKAQVAVRPAVGGGSATPTVVTPPAKSPCDTMDLEDLQAQAIKQFSAGYSASALSLIVKVLGCKQDARLYRLAAMFACAAHDVESARLYYNKVPAELRKGIEQKCQQEHIELPSP